MFTGIVEEIGTIQSVKKGAETAVLRISCEEVLKGTKIGDSIAVNGVCLTVTSMDSNGYTADVMTETMHRSSLGMLKTGSKVNLERAMAADGRFSGHIVAGHIDGTGIIEKITKDETAIWYQVSADEKLLRYIVEKGSITMDGISLTVAKVTENDFSVSIIPHTQKNTILSLKKVGDVINLETDIIGKYVEKLMQPRNSEKQDSKVTMEFLAEHGFC